MPKRFYYTRNVFFAALCACLFATFTFGQSGKLQADLNDSFKKFDLVKLDKQKARKQVETIQRLSIATKNKNFELNLIPNDLRASSYKAQDTAESGIQTLERGDVTTFKGKVAGEAGSDVRMTLSGAAIEGYVQVKGEKFFIEPAQKYSKFASPEDVVVYSAEDLLEDKSFTCDAELGKRIEHGREMVETNGVESVQQMRVVELATEADFQFVTRAGGAAQANSEILSTLNMVEGMYERELNLSISVTFQHTWSVTDPFDIVDAGTMLVSLKNYWNANFPHSQHQRNTTYLFSGKPNIVGIGVAYVGVVCNAPNFGYGLGGRTNSALANNLVVGHEIGHNLGANHVDATQNCANTTMNAVVSELTPPVFCSYSRNEVSNYVAGASCLKTKAQPPASPSNRAKFDFDGDGRADTAVWRQTNGVWYINNSSNSSFNFVQFGAGSDRLVPADYDGDGKTDIAVFRAGAWFILKSSTSTFDSVSFGTSTDIPAPADFDGDGKADIAVFRPSNGVWHRLMSGSGSAYSAVQFGANGDVPLPADYDGDRKADINVWRPATGIWYRLNSSNSAFYAAQFGGTGDKPVMGDFDGDGKADLVVWRPSNGVWYQLTSNGAFSGAAFGTSGDIPMAADFDGDGRTDLSVFRPSTGSSYRLNSSNGAFSSIQFGAAGDIPISASYNQ